MADDNVTLARIDERLSGLIEKVERLVEQMERQNVSSNQQLNDHEKRITRVESEMEEVAWIKRAILGGSLGLIVILIVVIVALAQVNGLP